ncbi:MAG: hypothetical protein GY895_02815 [Phycisphaera sp.]|nr:hypothetical protein [Phycisphaera sp.]
MSISVVSSFAAAQELPGGSVGLMTQGQSLDWEAGLDGQFSWTNDGYNFTGSDSGSGWAMQWNMLASGTASAESIVTSFTVINTGSTTETFYLHFHQAIMGDYATGSLVGGSIAGTFTDLNGNGVSVSALSGGSIYSALVDTTDPLTDGTIVGTLLDGQQGSASGFGSGNFLSESFGNVPSIPGANGPAIDSNFGVLLAFDLSAGDTAAFTTSMAIATPAPGALAMFGIAGLSRRRRRTA